MCSQTEKKVLNHVNRLFIGCAGVLGVLCDGFSNGDIFAITSIVVWLMQAEFSLLEERVLDFCKQHLSAH